MELESLFGMLDFIMRHLLLLSAFPKKISLPTAKRGRFTSEQSEMVVSGSSGALLRLYCSSMGPYSRVMYLTNWRQKLSPMLKWQKLRFLFRHWMGLLLLSLVTRDHRMTSFISEKFSILWLHIKKKWNSKFI